MATYLVTGGAGFIGSHIADALVKKGHRVRIMDNLSTGNKRNIESFASQVEFVEADIRDAGAVRDAVKGVDYVIHQAALASVPRSIDDPTSTNDVNVGGTLNLLEAARDEKVKRFVYASSSSVYGDSVALPKVETMPTDPRSPYAVSKLGGELYGVVFAQVYGLATVALRYFNVFGPRQDPNSQYSAVIPLFVKALLENRSPTIFGDGEQSRDFTYIDNVVAANLLVCESENTPGKVYNVACEERFTLNFLYEKLKNIIGVGLEATYGPPRAGDVMHSQASIGAIGSDTGYKPTIGFEEGLHRTIEWYRETEVTR